MAQPGEPSFGTDTATPLLAGRRIEDLLGNMFLRPTHPALLLTAYFSQRSKVCHPGNWSCSQGRSSKQGALLGVIQDHWEWKGVLITITTGPEVFLRETGTYGHLRHKGRRDQRW